MEEDTHKALLLLSEAGAPAPEDTGAPAGGEADAFLSELLPEAEGDVRVEPEDKTRRGKDRIKGIFSTQSVEKVGTGTTVRRTVQKTFWMVEELASGILEIQPLNKNYIPSGPKRRIAMDDLLQKFNPEPEFYVHTVFPAIQEMNRTLVRGEEHRAKGEYFSAEHEFSNALKVDVDNVRANFGLGLTYLERGEGKKADNIFERLVKLDAAFEPEHKHLFNEFGINLRKNKMYTQALDYYQRAMQLAQADENLHYNIARAFFEMGMTDRAVKHLRSALTMNPKLEAAQQFMTWLKDKGFLTEDGAATDKKGEAAATPEAPTGKTAGPEAPANTPDEATAQDAPLPAGIDLGSGYNVD